MSLTTQDPVRRVATISRVIARPFRETLDRITAKGHDDLSIRQLRVLFAVSGEPQTVQDLAMSLNVHKAVITRAADKLGEQGLTRRRPHTDRRMVWVGLTHKGAKLVKEIGA